MLLSLASTASWFATPLPGGFKTAETVYFRGDDSRHFTSAYDYEFLSTDKPSLSLQSITTMVQMGALS